MTEQIIIEFVSDPSGLQPTEDKLAALGKVDKQAADVFKQTNTELKKREQNIASVSNANAKLKTSYDGLRTAVLKESQVLKLSADEFKKTGKTLEQLVSDMKGATAETKKNTDETVKGATAQKSLRQELRQITEQLARLKLEGKENTAQYQQLSAAASKYRDTLGDVGREINRAASDTRKLDTLVEGATGIAAAFSIAQGAAGLFGDKSEELQEVLLRVQSAMAVLNGLQSIQNLLQKESNILRFVSNQQLKLAVVVTNLETAAQSKNIVVKGLATGAMRVLNTVMKANPAFLLIAVFAALAGALVFFTGKTKNAEKAADAFNKELEEMGRTVQAVNDAIAGRAALDIKNLELAGAKQSEISKTRLRQIKEEKAAQLGFATEEDRRQQEILDNVEITGEKRKELFNQSLADQKGYIKKAQDLERDSQQQTVQIQIDIKDEQKAANEKAIENSKKAAEKRKEIRLKELEDIKAGIQLQLLEVAKGSQAEIDLKKKLLTAQLNIDLDNEKLTANQRKLLIQESFHERIKLEKDFSAEVKRLSLEGLQSNLNAELANIDISNQRKVDLTIQLLEVQRNLELAAVLGNKQKEKEINAKFDKEISEQSVAIRKAGLDEELALLTAQQGARKRALEDTAADQNADISARIIAIDELLQIEKDSIKQKTDLNNSLYKDGLISSKAYFLTNAELIDADKKAVEDSEKAKQNAIDQTNEKRKLTNQELITAAFETTRQTIDTLSTLYDFIGAREQNALDTQRQRIKDLQDAGAISEKEAKERFKRLDVEERKNKQQAAQRSKAIEVFNSILAIPAAFLKGLKDGGYVLAAIYAGLAGAQAALIAAKPIPKFGKGKRSQYEGLGEVGEAGTELIEKGGKMYVADKPQIIWLAKSDKVYNPKETIDMINRSLPKIDKRIMNFSSNNSSNTNIDYEKLGKAVGKNIPQVGFNFDEDGFTQYQKSKNDYTRYLNNRRSF